ncbi:MAG TPA: lasso RiPP family leader peptide-containing protein [Thermoanaerobaculia bacterium]|nr:lasso RiPP family leader peptide-containing protein [Thermoanaerobaculia bacterium]
MTEQKKQPSGKKPYAAPRLVVYGDIRKLTENSARNAFRDGGSNSART